MRINLVLELLDSPGILWPKLEDQEAAHIFASLSSIKEEILDIDDIANQQIKNPLTGICLEKDNYRLYMKTWAQVLNEAEARFNYLKEKLQNERNRLANSDNLDFIMEQTLNNTAVENDVK